MADMQPGAPAPEQAAPEGGNPLEAIGQMVEGMMAAAEQAGNKDAMAAAQQVAAGVEAFMGAMSGKPAEGQAVPAAGQGANAVPAEM